MPLQPIEQPVCALQVVHRVNTRHLPGRAKLNADEADSRAVTLIQRFGADGAAEFVEVSAATDEALQTVLPKMITSQPPDRQKGARSHALRQVGSGPAVTHSDLA